MNDEVEPQVTHDEEIAPVGDERTWALLGHLSHKFRSSRPKFRSVR